MVPSKSLIAGLSVLAFVIGSGKAEATPIDLTGKTIQYTWLFGNSAIDGPQNAVVGPGVEFLAFGQSFVTIDVSASNIRIDWDLTSSPQFTPNSFNGPTFFDIFAAIGPITSVTLNQSTLAGFNASRILFDSDTIRLNFESLQMQAGHTVVSVDINPESTSAVPEPMSLVLLGTGLIGIASKGRRRRTA